METGPIEVERDGLPTSAERPSVRRNARELPLITDRNATVIPSEHDTSRCADLVGELVAGWVAEASLLGDAAGAGVLLARAAEALEIAGHDPSMAEELFRRAAGHVDADARAFAGVRRFARLRDDHAAVHEVYELELERASSPPQRLFAAATRAAHALRRGSDPATIARRLRESIERDGTHSGDLRLVAESVLEDVLIAAGALSEALALRFARSEVVRSDERFSSGATATRDAVAAELLGGTPDAVRRAHERAFDEESSAASARTLLRAELDRANWPRAVALLRAILDGTAARTEVERGLCSYALGAAQAWKIGDIGHACDALITASGNGATGPVAGSMLLAVARASSGSVTPTDEVDALGRRCDLAASSTERAFVLTEMARCFESSPELSEAAIELAREALTAQPGFAPAVALLGRCFEMCNRWDDLAELDDELLESGLDGGAAARLRAAELCSVRLRDDARAERHLRAGLASEADLATARKLARLLASQNRWPELYELLVAMADRVEDAAERRYFTARAAHVAESRLRDDDAAADLYRTLIEEGDTQISARAALGRLLHRTEAWEELIALNDAQCEEHASEADRRGDHSHGVTVRIGLSMRSAEICRDELRDREREEHYLRQALALDPAYEPALWQLGRILRAGERWEELAEVTMDELAAVERPVRRIRCLRRLAELHVGPLFDAERAESYLSEMSDFDGAVGDEALLRLEALHEATDEPAKLLDVLERRLERCADESGRVRLRFRIATLLEWRLDGPAQAFDAYLDALADRLTVRAAIDGLDRLWERAELDESARRDAIARITEAADGHGGEVRLHALEVAAERSADVYSFAERAELWHEVVRLRPDDVVAAEFCALVSLRERLPAYAWKLRGALALDAPERAVVDFYRLETVDGGEVVPSVGPDALPAFYASYAREAGMIDNDADLFRERVIIAELLAGEVTLGQLAAGDGSELSLRLARLAARPIEAWDDVARAGIALARAATDPRCALRRWLDLARESGFDAIRRRTWLREAAELGCYGHTLRGELYDAFESVADAEGLADAIEDHLVSGRPALDDAAVLGARRAAALESIGRYRDAADAYRDCTILVPSDPDYARSRARLEARLGAFEAGRAALSGCLDAGCDGEARVGVLADLAALHLEEGGTPAQAVAALEDAFVLSGESSEWALRLASIHADHGSARRAATLLEEHLTVPLEHDQLDWWERLAELYRDRLDDEERAEEILWGLYTAFPTDARTLISLEEHYKRPERGAGSAAEFVDRLRHLAASTELPMPDEKLADLWVYIGEIELSVLRRPAAAEASFERARALVGEPPRLALRRARALVEQRGRAREAVAAVIDALDRTDGQGDVWGEGARVLEDLFHALEDDARLHVARSLRRLLGDDSVAVRVDSGPRPTRVFDRDAAWDCFGGALISEVERDVLAATAPLVEKVLGSVARKRNRADRADASELYDVLLADACEWLDVDVPRIYYTARRGGVVALEGGSFEVEARRVGDEMPLRARFWAGYCAGLAFSGLAPYSWLDEPTVRDLFLALEERVLDRDVGRRSSLHESIGGILLAPARRTAATALREHPEVAAQQGRDWPALVRSFADRAGLVFCGDLGVAVDEIRRASGWRPRPGRAPTAAEVVQTPRARRLLRFALGDAHQRARYESGLTHKPTIG